MMLAYRLVRLIETHSDGLAASLLKKVQDSLDYQSLCRRSYRKSSNKVCMKSTAIWGNGFSAGANSRSKPATLEIGARRAHQGVPLSQLTWAIILTKENLWEFVKEEIPPERALEIFGELEFLQMLERFFDRAIYSASVGYELAVSAQANPGLQPHAKSV